MPGVREPSSDLFLGVGIYKWLTGIIIAPIPFYYMLYNIQYALSS